MEVLYNNQEQKYVREYKPKKHWGEISKAETVATLWSNLRISAMVEIVQFCKLDHVVVL